VWIDETGRNHFPTRVDRPRRRAGDAADTRDPAVANGHRSCDRRSAGAIDDAGVGDEEIEWPGRLLG
jgi:hypothetical protein